MKSAVYSAPSASATAAAVLLSVIIFDSSLLNIICPPFCFIPLTSASASKRAGISYLIKRHQRLLLTTILPQLWLMLTGLSIRQTSLYQILIISGLVLSWTAAVMPHHAGKGLKITGSRLHFLSFI